MVFNLDKFIADSVTFRPVSMFVPDNEANAEPLGHSPLTINHNP